MHSDVFSDGYGIKSLISYNYFCSVQTADMFTLVVVVIMQKISLSTKKLNTFGEKKKLRCLNDLICFLWFSE